MVSSTTRPETHKLIYTHINYSSSPSHGPGKTLTKEDKPLHVKQLEGQKKCPLNTSLKRSTTAKLIYPYVMEFLFFTHHIPKEHMENCIQKTTLNDLHRYTNIVQLGF